MAYGSLKDAYDASNLLWMLVWSLCVLLNRGYFGHFVMFLNFSSPFQESTRDFGDFFLLN